MPNTRISDLTAATSVAGTDVYPSVQTAGVGPVKTSLTQITAFALANAPAGAVATPSIAPTGDTNTGFWFPAADTIAASTGGSERLRINSSGNVGIGTASPSDRFVVENASANVKSRISAGGSASYTASLALGTTTRDWEATAGGSSSNYLFSLNYTGTDAPLSNIFVATKGGNVGIGTASPGAALDVFGNIYISNATTSGGAALVGRAAGSNTWIVGPDNSINGGTDQGLSLYSYGATNVRFYTNATERMRITSAGNVGIGVSPSAWASSVTALQLPTGAFYSFNSGSVSNFYMMANAYLNSGGSSAYKSTAAATQYVQTGGSHVWSYAASGTADAVITWSEAMRITSAGNVGIGTTPSATNRLSVNGAYDSATPSTSSPIIARLSNGGAISTWFGGSAYSYCWLQAIQDDGTNNLKNFVLQPLGGGVGIGGNSSGKFDVFNSSTLAFRVDTSGNIYGAAGTTAMTNGFFYMPAAAGAPSGTPSAVTGTVPFYYDTTNNQFYVYNGAWKKVTLA